MRDSKHTDEKANSDHRLVFVGPILIAVSVSQAPLDASPSSAEPVDPSMKRGSPVQWRNDCDAGASAMTAG